jgi:tetratricopeptide (TPR) repeat protein
MLNRRLLEDAFSGLIRRSPGGVYPALEIHTPDDSDYSLAMERLKQMPRRNDEQAVWAVNSELTKAIFDKNPNHEFYLEESLALPWMYPHLVPYGIIMKIERTPVAEWSADQQGNILARDRAFWTQYMDRLIGKEIAQPNTPMTNICDWVSRVYIRRNHKEHTPIQQRFLRSYVSQRAFSKLRLSIAKLYDWRTKNIDNLIVKVTVDKAGSGRIKQLMKRKKTLLAEADFAFRQAYALCPVSAETAHEYLTFLLRIGKTKEAQLLLATSFQLDPSDDALSIWTRRDLWHQALADYSVGNLTSARSIVKIGREHFPKFTTYNPNLVVPEDKVLNYNLTDRAAFDNLLSRGKYEEAYKHINRAIPRKPGPTPETTKIDWSQPFNWKSLISYTEILTGQLEAKPEDFMLQILSSQVFRFLRTLAKNREQIVRAQQKYGVIQKPPYPFRDLQKRFLEAEAKLRRQLTKQTPSRPDAWYELGVTLNHLRQTKESIDCLKKAWGLSGQSNAPRSIVNIRELIRTTNALDNLRDLPEFKAIIQKP